MDGERTKKDIIVIEDLNSYLSAVSGIRKRIKESEGEDLDSQRFFFRGQANRDWDILPGIFRDNFLSLEAELIKEANLRNPSDFRMLNNFEKLAKLQHYGLPTRLLDVTSNPLVALYFACQPETALEEIDGNEESVEKDGIVFFQRTYGKGCTDLAISVISYLSTLEIDGDMTLEKILEMLTENGIYTANMAKSCRDGGYKSLIDILQDNYFVVPNLNNERLIRQSGAFLLAGQYNIILNSNNRGNSVVQPARGLLRSEFAQQCFIIPADKKEEVLEELDFCNINEGSLFPELEHQMIYIKQIQANKPRPFAGLFSKVDMANGDSDKVTVFPDIEISEDDLDNIIDGVLKTSVKKIMVDECKIAIKDNLSIDWYKKESVVSRIRVALTDAISQYKIYNRGESKILAVKIVEKIIVKMMQRSEQIGEQNSKLVV